MLNLPFFVAWRYLFAKKSHNAINIITGISVLVLALSTTAMVLILSVFNGLENLIADLYNSSRPDIEISSLRGKYFDFNTLDLDLEKDKNVICWSEVIEDMALAKYQPAEGVERQSIVKLKAVSPNYHCMSGIDTLVYDGSFFVEYNQNYFAVAAYGVAARLDMRLNSPESTIILYYPNSNASETDLLNAFNIETVMPAGVVSLQQEDDERLVYISLNLARKLMNLSENQITSVEIQLNKEVSTEEYIRNLKTKLGEEFVIKDRKQMNATLYNITRSEKWSGFMILSFIVLLAAFNLVGSLAVLIIEKKEDIKIFKHIGLSKSRLRRIFLIEGFLITFSGGIFGLILGIILVIIQQKFHIIPMSGGFAVSSFPVTLLISDLILVLVVVLFVGIVSTLLPVSSTKLTNHLD